MKEIKEGFFAVEEKMPCLPGDLRFERYTLPGIFVNLGQEEAAARLLSFSQDMGEWVGVSWSNLIQTLFQERREEDERYLASSKKYQKEIERYIFLSSITFGIYGHFKPLPREEKAEKPRIITAFRPDMEEFIVRGIRELIDKSMITGPKYDPGILFPTPTLISRVWEEQMLQIGRS